MDKSGKLTDMVHEEEDVRKSVEKRRDFPDKVEIVENAQTVMVTNKKPGGMALFLANNREEEIEVEKDTRYGEDEYRTRHGIGEIIKCGVKRKRGRKKLTRTKQTVKLPPTPCGICRRDVNRWMSVLCRGCKMYIHLQKKCSGLESEKQYNKDYRCSRCVISGEVPEVNNHHKEQSEKGKIAGRKRKNTEKEGPPVKVNPMREVNNSGEKNPSERKPTEGAEKSKLIVPNQTNETLTTIDGIQITKEDRLSLQNGKNVTCTIISLFIKKFEDKNKELIEVNKILMIQPAMAQLLQLQERTYVKEQKKYLNMTKYDWILFPVSNRENPMEGDGGKHFSLLIFSKCEHKFFHFDPINGINRKNALDLMTNLMDSESVNKEGNLYKLPVFEEVKCEQQRNGFDCGIFTMNYMADAIEKINKGNTPRNLVGPPLPNGALGMRIGIAELIDESINTNLKLNGKSDPSSDKVEEPNNNEIVIDANESIEMTCERLDNLLNEEIGNPDENNNSRKNIDKDSEQNNIGSNNEDKDPDEQKTSKTDGIDSTGSNKNTEKVLNSKDNNNKQEEIKTMNRNNNKDSRERQDKNLSSKDRSMDCRYYINDSCRYGKRCRYKHREVCRGWKINGQCGKDKCTFEHPEPCIHHLKGTCQRRSCWYLHTLEKPDPKYEIQQEKQTPMQKQQEHNEVSRKKYHVQNFWEGQNRGQEIQKKKTAEEKKATTQQQSIDMIMGAMESLTKGLELILTQTEKH